VADANRRSDEPTNGQTDKWTKRPMDKQTERINKQKGTDVEKSEIDEIN